MAECKKESCEGCPSASSCGQKPASMLAPANPASHIHKVVGIVSGSWKIHGDCISCKPDGSTGI